MLLKDLRGLVSEAKISVWRDQRELFIADGNSPILKMLGDQEVEEISASWAWIGHAARMGEATPVIKIELYCSYEDRTLWDLEAGL